MEQTNPMNNGIRMIYGMMIMLTLLILVSLVIDAKATPQGPSAAQGSSVPTDQGYSNDESGESGVGSGGEGKVTQIAPREKRHEAPKEMIVRADAYLKALLGESYVTQFITYDESYKERVYVGSTLTLPDARKELQAPPTKGEDIQGAPIQSDIGNSEERWIIVYMYQIKAQGPVDPMAEIIRVTLDMKGNVVGYDGPEYPYQFKLGVDDVKKIARDAGMKTPNEAFIRPGWMGWLADDSLVLGDEKESIMWQVVSNTPDVGTPEVVYIDVDSGKILGISTKRKEEFTLFGSIGAPLPEGAADAQQKATATSSKLNEKVKADLAKLRAGIPKVAEGKMEKFLKGEKSEGKSAGFFKKMLAFFTSLWR